MEISPQRAQRTAEEEGESIGRVDTTVRHETDPSDSLDLKLNSKIATRKMATSPRTPSIPGLAGGRMREG